jgi:hypothetical protein
LFHHDSGATTLSRLTRLIHCPYLGPVAASAALLFVAIWLNAQFDAGRSSFRAISAMTVIWISIVAVALVTVAWLLASYLESRRSDTTGTPSE